MKDVNVGDKVRFNPPDLVISYLTGTVLDLDCGIVVIKVDDQHIKKIKQDSHYHTNYLWECNGLDEERKSRFYLSEEINLEIINDDVIEF